jgi:hypothetical protein
MFILSAIGDTTFDIGPGDLIWIAAKLCPGMLVGVKVTAGVTV